MNHNHGNGHTSSHSKHKGHTPEMFFNKFLISLILTVPVVLYSELPEKILSWKAPLFLGSEFIPLILGSIVFFYGGWIFLEGAYREIKWKMPGMMTLVSLAILSAYIFSVYSGFAESKNTLFWELTTLITIMLLGHWLEMKTVSGAQDALKELAKLLPDTAEIIKNGKSEIIPLPELKEGDIVFVRPGGKIPADGEIIEGKSEVNESMITGESKPILKKEKDQVIAGTANGDGSLKIKILKIGENTFLAGIMRLVMEAQSSKSKLQIISDRAAFYLTIIAIVSGGITFMTWILAKAGASFAVERMISVFVIACPHALGLAVPLVASISTVLAAKNGFLVRQRIALETARKINIVLFDKTGTLTKGEYGVDKIISNGEKKENEILRLAASVDNHSEHFVAKAINKKAEKNNLQIIDSKDFQRLPGKGTTAIIGGEKIFVGGEAILSESKNLISEEIKSKITALAGQGKTIIYVLSEKELFGIIVLADLIRDESKDVIESLKKISVKVAMITGDSEDVARWVSKDLGIDEYFAKVMPDQKADKVKFLQSKGNRVAMIGDGINDAPALAQADLGIAIGAGTNIAIESAGIILIKNDPRDIAKIIKLSKLTYRKMMQNIFWATGYNIVALPLAGGVLASKGIFLQPATSAVLMSLSTVIVAVNAIFLAKAKF
ncbi:MAG: heavy metal translocating P-type ATPase [Patescibacteria group bacterium]|nr:heavy metal translocating P-type ATPase [Patescibacteria group bacterium]